MTSTGIKILMDGVWSPELIGLLEEFGYSKTDHPETVEMLCMNPREALRRSLEEILKLRIIRADLEKQSEEYLDALEACTEDLGRYVANSYSASSHEVVIRCRKILMPRTLAWFKEYRARQGVGK